MTATTATGLKAVKIPGYDNLYQVEAPTSTMIIRLTSALPIDRMDVPALPATWLDMERPWSLVMYAARVAPRDARGGVHSGWYVHTRGDVEQADPQGPWGNRKDVTAHLRSELKDLENSK